jgi:hypothetical protein
MKPSGSLAVDADGSDAGRIASPEREQIGYHLKRAGSLLLQRLGFSESLLREGLVAGIRGAVCIAVWFLLLDTLQGRPLYTPIALGSVLFQQPEVAPLADLALSFLMVLFYTLVHGLVFCLIGCIAARFFVEAEKHPAYLFGLLLFFIFFCAGLLTLALAFSAPLLKVLSPLAILAGNLLAAGFMIRYLWKRHPLDFRQLL